MTDSSPSKVEAAKDQAAGLKDEALASGQHVAETAADQAGAVVGEARVQVGNLLGQAQSELREQAGTQQKRVAAGLRSVSDELSSMADSSSAGGVASDLVQQAATRAGGIASWLEGRDAGTLLSDVRAYAARKPGTFIAAAAIAGVVAGRLTRSLAGNAKEEHDQAASAPATTPVASAPASSFPVAPIPSTYAEPATAASATAESTYAAPAYTNPLYADAASTDGAAPIYADATASSGVDPVYADAAPVDDVTLRSHNLDDEYGDSSTVESLFDEPAASSPSFDETVRGDDYRGERS